MSGDTRTTTAVVLDRWATHLSELRLRVERDEDDPDHEPYEVLIGRRDYQGIELELAPGRAWGSRKDSQSCERFRQGAVEFTTAWDDGWTEVPKPEGYGYLDWVEESLRQMVACHLRWGVETALDPRGHRHGTLQLARELLQVQQFGGADFKLTEVVTDLMAVADAWVRASTGDEAATHTRAQAAAASVAGLDDKESTLSLLVAGARDLPDAQRDAFAGPQRRGPHECRRGVHATRGGDRRSVAR